MVDLLSWRELYFVQVKLDTRGYTTLAHLLPATDCRAGWAWWLMTSEVQPSYLEGLLTGSCRHLRLQMKHCPRHGSNLVDSDWSALAGSVFTFGIDTALTTWIVWQGQERMWSQWKHTGCRIRKPVWILSLFTGSCGVLGQLLTWPRLATSQGLVFSYIHQNNKYLWYELSSLLERCWCIIQRRLRHRVIM